MIEELICHQNTLVKHVLPKLNLKLLLVGRKPTIKVIQFIMRVLMDTILLRTHILILGRPSRALPLDEEVTRARVDRKHVLYALDLQLETEKHVHGFQHVGLH